ncbi:hypothetical protein A200_00600 [Parascardovia denticolens IPLA 20019]|uniref:hypothetical protein n=1 Tax=Parascardovia denticolens TaxID=78258 RepID=UPI000266AEB9|nr:hypothetical protein [Parascardovia denticolens]EIT88953.1 hypothetical protein A200_00600 [Parascardovia denticolens IPLA 20019]
MGVNGKILDADDAMQEFKQEVGFECARAMSGTLADVAKTIVRNHVEAWDKLYDSRCGTAALALNDVTGKVSGTMKGKFSEAIETAYAKETKTFNDKEAMKR